jgi:L-2-hydroxyglutarate oxidase LhgO
VLHAGFYYTSDSLKATFTRLGNQQLTEFFNPKNIPLNNCGKLVVVKKPEDIPQLDERFWGGWIIMSFFMILLKKKPGKLNLE